MKNDQLKMYIFKNNYLPSELRSDIVASMSEYDWQKHYWYTIDNGVETTNSREEGELEISYGNEELSNVLSLFTVDALKDYQEYTNFRTFGSLVQQVSKPRINKYSVGDDMESHIDHIHDLFDGHAKGIPVLSIVGLINDDFKGGEFVFWDDYKVSLKAGDIMVFPSNFMYRHRVNTVTENVRFSFVSWAW